MRKFLVPLCIALLLGTAGAVRVNSLDITAELDKAGNAHVLEAYALGFLAGELERFKNDAAENSSSLISWQVDYNWFRPHFEPGGLESSRITFDESSQVLFLDYYLKQPLAELVRDEPRATVWKLADRKFGQFMAQGTIMIPQDTRVSIKLPGGSVVASSMLLHEAVVFDSTVLLSGVTTSYVNLQYSVPKPIAAPLDLVALLGQTNIIILICAVIALVVVLYLKRRPIAARIENYIIEHSSIEPHAEEGEDLELEE